MFLNQPVLIKFKNMEAKTSKEKNLRMKKLLFESIDEITILEEFESIELGDGFNAFDEEFQDIFSSKN